MGVPSEQGHAQRGHAKGLWFHHNIRVVIRQGCSEQPRILLCNLSSEPRSEPPG